MPSLAFFQTSLLTIRRGSQSDLKGCVWVGGRGWHPEMTELPSERGW